MFSKRWEGDTQLMKRLELPAAFVFHINLRFFLELKYSLGQGFLTEIKTQGLREYE